ncbi:MAG TPA: ABC transporter substrate-binding protein, partial [Actinomycetota bacterium]|nr:ABC transporter substrate-binding protein [Actinomycetota bacterium]
RTGISRDEIRIGIHAPITGAAAIQTFDKGIEVYSRFAGKIAGAGNRSLKVVYRDDKFNPSSAVDACKDMVQREKVFLLIGGAGADQIEACAKYANTVGVPYLSPGVTEGGFRNLPNYFALSETYNQQNVQIGQLIKNQVQGKTKVGIVLTDSPLLDETNESIRKELGAAGLTPLKTYRLPKDANANQARTIAGNLKDDGAEVVYALISPTVFIYLVGGATSNTYFPTFVGPGLSNGLNLVAAGICSNSPNADVRYLSPMVQLDKIDQQDKDYRPAYRQKNGAGNEPDDIGILLWGLEKSIRLMVEATGPDISRQSFISTLKSGKTFATNVYAPVKYGNVPHFGASQITLLKMNCNRREFDTVAMFVSSF